MVSCILVGRANIILGMFFTLVRQCFQAHDVILGLSCELDSVNLVGPFQLRMLYDLMINPDLAKWFSSINVLSCTYTVDASESYSHEIFRHSSVFIMDYCPWVSAFLMAALSTKTLNRHTPHRLWHFSPIFFPQGTHCSSLLLFGGGVQCVLVAIAFSCVYNHPQFGHLVSRRENKSK